MTILVVAKDRLSLLAPDYDMANRASIFYAKRTGHREPKSDRPNLAHQPSFVIFLRHFHWLPFYESVIW
jgi:hypothetical protein